MLCPHVAANIHGMNCLQGGPKPSHWDRLGWDRNATTVALAVQGSGVERAIGMKSLILLQPASSPKVAKMAKLCPKIDVLGTNLYG